MAKTLVVVESPAKAKTIGKYLGPGYMNWDISVFKHVPLGGGRRLQFRADFFNVLNHPQFAEPISDPLNANFGRITRTSVTNRVVQLGLHLFW